MYTHTCTLNLFIPIPSCTHCIHTHSHTHTYTHMHLFTHPFIHTATPLFFFTRHTAAGPYACQQAMPDVSTRLLHTCSLVIPIGELGRLPPARELVDSGIQSFMSSEDTPMNREHTILNKFQGPEQESVTGCQWINVGAGLPALPKKLVEQIRANKYINFADLPQAKGKSRPLP